MRITKLLAGFLVMLFATIFMTVGLVRDTSERNWIMVALFSITVPAEAGITLRLFYILIWRDISS